MLSEFHLTKSNTSCWSIILGILSGKFSITIIKLLSRSSSSTRGHGCRCIWSIQYLFYLNARFPLIFFILYVIVVNIVDPWIWSSILHILYTFGFLKSWIAYIIVLLRLHKTHSGWSCTIHVANRFILTFTTISVRFCCIAIYIIINLIWNVSWLINLLHILASSLLTWCLNNHDMLQAEISIDDQTLLDIIVNTVHCKIHAIHIK